MALIHYTSILTVAMTTMLCACEMESTYTVAENVDKPICNLNEHPRISLLLNEGGGVSEAWAIENGKSWAVRAKAKSNAAAKNGVRVTVVCELELNR